MPRPVKNITAHRRRLAAAERAEYLDRKTDNGAEVWDFYLNMMRDTTLDVKDRERAAAWISEHSTAGKVAAQLDVNVSDDREPDHDLSGLSLDELRAYEALLAKACGKPVAELPEAIVEAEIVPDHGDENVQ